MGAIIPGLRPNYANPGKLGFGAVPTLGYIEALNPAGVTAGKGLLLRNVDGVGGTTWNLTTTDNVALINLQFKQQSGSAGQLWGMRIITDSDVVDTAAAIGIENLGHSDSIYIKLAGRSGAEALNKPTGLAIEANRGASTGNPGAPIPVVAYENATAFQGTPITMWDYSQTSNGIIGMVYLRKLNNANSQNTLLRIEGNRNSIDIVQDETNTNSQLSGGGSITTAYDGTAPQIRLYTSGSALLRWQLKANADLDSQGRFAVYNTDIGNASSERARLWWNSSSTRFELIVDRNGSSALNRDLGVGTNNQGHVKFLTNAVTRFYFDGVNGHFLAFTDNSFDLGASGATRPRSLYLGTNATVAGEVRVAGSGTGLAGHVTLTGSENTATVRSTGIGTIKFADGTARDCVGFHKMMVGTVAYYVPLFASN